jgi:hypothetical protein
MKFEQPTIELLKIKTEEVAAKGNPFLNPSGADGDADV